MPKTGALLMGSSWGAQTLVAAPVPLVRDVTQPILI